MKKKVAIVGVTGYSGVELVRLLLTHPSVEINGLYAHSTAGQLMNEQYPSLSSICEQEIQVFDAKKIMEENDAVFFATPSGVSKKDAISFIQADFPVIDLSGDFRLNQEEYEKWYHSPACEQKYLDKAQYSLADLERAEKHYIANPGCYATATLLALHPIAQTDWFDVESIIVDAKSGLSGAGKKLSETSHFSFISDNLFLYKQNQHQHIPEIVQKLQTWNEEIPYIQFQTTLVPATRGIFISCYIKMKKELSEQDIYDWYERVYKGKKFIRLQNKNTLPSMKQVVGSNYCDIGLSYNSTTHVLTVVSVIDNLIKGAAGQAIQNFNQLFGMDETLGLQLAPVFP
ncbi:N-acetyl-gamma-glutamyl-phosphate reductase [Pilibacter termitis]|uniref:N-acetyl-gamma-glutamyl-phosphate reductase n=1 Tax=Pilibacter termitis TaxID=263852 RepID=A0A1T4MR43_9ENTE|nr:N-acetyl-gamma-glutamyl-phosphate reductase [Pilibacter termitis]SJZ69433.1 N-acetyl-gamma-glutamyl-phosphate reductase [Pilibacter termitis]